MTHNEKIAKLATIREPSIGRRAGVVQRPLKRWLGLGLGAQLSSVAVLVYVLLAFFGAQIAPYSATDFDMLAILQPPSVIHFFGTDGFGRDVFSRVLVGARTILMLGGVATIFGVGLGCSLGLISGFLGDVIDEILMRLVDVFLALPGLLLALLILTSLGPSKVNLVVSIAIVFVPKSARIARGAIMPLRALGFVDAARMRGASWPTLVFRELLPNVLDEITVEFSLRFAYALLLISSLGFLGLGVQPPTPDWGLMISESRNFITIAPWLLLFPALAIGGIVVAVNVLGTASTGKIARRTMRYL